jgi:2-hydroxy-3-oxopropionate reductase
MNTVGFVGLGVMGAPMAANLVAAGYAVTGYSRTAITMLPDHPEVEEVVLGGDGVLDNARPGSLLVDMSTVRPETAVALARAGAERDVRVLDAPVSGGEVGARQGTLSVMVGGEDADVAAARPVLEVLGKTIVHVGPHGAGQVVKAANQLVVAGIYAAVSEAIVLLEASGVDPEAGLDVLAGGLAGNRILDLKRESMIAHEFRPGFRIDLHHKDMGIVLDAARSADVALPVSGLLAQLMAAARAMGHGSLDHSALLTVVETLSGRAR